jgi:dTDP-N-acetylfucosamine:lipid II N-acetylfucosaminyltransferase
MKILHLATDEKFINAANLVFEHTFPGQNLFIIVKSPSNPPLKHVSDLANIKYIVQSASTAEQVIALAGEFELIILHGLDAVKIEVFQRLKFDKRFIWFVWGAEVYNSAVFDCDFVLDKTKEFLEETIWLRTIEYLKQRYRKFRYGSMGSAFNSQLKSTIYEMPAVGILHKEEVDFFKTKGLLHEESHFIPFTYYPLEFLFKEEVNKDTSANILLGNSASPTNNHREVMDRLCGCELGERRIITPLSYGDKGYAKKVMEYGKKKLGANFQPIIDFMPLSKYNELITSCGIVIMNMTRQQAVGNIITSIYLGAKVYLNETTVYEYLKNRGYYIFLIPKDFRNDETALNPLSEWQADHNRSLIKQEISLDVVSQKLHRSILNYAGNETGA